MNVAARLEALAEPGGIVVSGVVHENVRGRVSCMFDDLGGQTVKNIARPVRTCRVVSERVGVEREQALPLPDEPSVAVLPFQNMSGDPEQEYFADGVVEGIITSLSRSDCCLSSLAIGDPGSARPWSLCSRDAGAM